MADNNKVYRGQVKWFDSQRGYGFVASQELKNDVFVHFSAINMEGYKKLDDNQQVEFQVVHTDRGPQAANVTAL